MTNLKTPHSDFKDGEKNLETKWSVTTLNGRSYGGGVTNIYLLSMTAKHFIEVNGIKQLFIYSDEIREPDNVKDCLILFEERAKSFFDRIEKAVNSPPTEF